MARLRAALDELTAGAEPSEATVTPLSSRRPRRWLVPALGAAAVALLVAVAVSAAGRGDGAPAAPTPTGPALTPVPTTPTSTAIPWYGLNGPNGLTATPPLDVDPLDFRPAQVWASPDYSRVLVVSSASTPGASDEPDDWPVIEQLAEPPSGVAWAFRGGDPTTRLHGIYWAPDDHTRVVVTGYGFDPDDLGALLPALELEPTATGPHISSALSSLVPLPESPRGFYSAPYTDSDHPITDGQAVALYAAAGGVARPLALWGPVATAITATTTPFGAGIRMETDGPTHVWWQVDGGPFWAGISAPPDQIDELLARVTRVADVAAPTTSSSPDEPAVAPPTSPPATMMASGPGSTPPLHSTISPDEASEPTLPQSTAAPVTLTAPRVDNEPTQAPTTVPVEQRPPVAFGESVMLSAATSLEAAGFAVVAEEAVQASDIVQMIREARAAEQLGRIVIVQVGTNGTITQDELDQLMAELPPEETPLVIVLTVHADRSWIAGNNELIRALPARYPHVKVVDWDQIATVDPRILTSDGIHVADRRAYTEAIASVIEGT